MCGEYVEKVEIGDVIQSEEFAFILTGKEDDPLGKKLAKCRFCVTNVTPFILTDCKYEEIICNIVNDDQGLGQIALMFFQGEGAKGSKFYIQKVKKVGQMTPGK
jgi:hypothetical protein